MTLVTQMVPAVLVLTGLAGVTGALLGYASSWFPADEASLADQIDALLPQTQCAQCGYPGCRPYAQAIVDGEAQIDQCPPGGQAGVDALATLLGKAVIPLNPAYGDHKPAQVAFIRETECIGCTLCIKACPVDAIVGAAKLMHTVIADHCTGCELCIAPCPVDCIDLRALNRSSSVQYDTHCTQTS